MNVSRTFRTSADSYAILCGVLSIPFLLGLWSTIWGTTDFLLLLISATMPSVAALWLACFRLRIGDSGIEYRDLFGRNFDVAYSEIISLKSRSVSYGGRSGHELVLHLRDGRNLRLNLKPFSREVYGILRKRIGMTPDNSLERTREE